LDGNTNTILGAKSDMKRFFKTGFVVRGFYLSRDDQNEINIQTMWTAKAYIMDAKENKYLNWEALACYYVNVIIFFNDQAAFQTMNVEFL
jgi:hypothetical protein